MSPFTKQLLTTLGFDVAAFKAIMGIDLSEHELQALILTKVEALAGGVDLSAPGPIGDQTPDTGEFTTLSAIGGTSALPSYHFATRVNQGMYSLGDNAIGLSPGGFAAMVISTGPTNGIALNADTPISWSLNPDAINSDTVLRRDAANTLALRNGTNAQLLVIYNTYTDGINYERAGIGWAGNRFYFSTDNNGTGQDRGLSIRAKGGIHFDTGTGDTTRWQISTGGHFLAADGADNTYDIGASGANRPRNVNVADAVVAGVRVKTSTFELVNSGYFIGMGDGVMKLSDLANTAFNRLQFGGTTASFPALKRVGTTLSVRLADDSGDADLSAGVATVNRAVTQSLNLSGIPTSNPNVAGDVWNDGGTLKVSAG